MPINSVWNYLEGFLNEEEAVLSDLSLFRQFFTALFGIYFF